MTVGALQAGTKANVIPDDALIKVNVRTYDEAVRTHVLDAISRIAHAEADASGAPRPPEITASDRYDLVTNDPDATERVRVALRSRFGPERVAEIGPLSASEDFGSFGKAATVPSVFWTVGGTDPDAYRTAEEDGRLADLPTNHNPRFEADHPSHLGDRGRRDGRRRARVAGCGVGGRAPVTATEHDTARPTAPGDAWLLGIVLAVVTFWLFAQTLLNVIPGIQGSLGLDTTVANLAVSVTALMSGMFIVVLGGLADRVGRAKVLRAGIGLSILGSLLIVVTPADHGALTATTIMAGRVVQGLSAACVMPSSLALIKDFYDGERRNRALSFWSIGSWGGSGFCALFGGLMAASFLGWRSIFVISIGVALLSVFLLRSTPPSQLALADPTRRFDWSGLLTFVAAMLAINVFISQGPSLGWFSGASLGLVAAFVVSIVAFFRIETTRSGPFVHLTIFDNKTFAGATLSNFLLNGSAGTLVVSLGLV